MRSSASVHLLHTRGKFQGEAGVSATRWPVGRGATTPGTPGPGRVVHGSDGERRVGCAGEPMQAGWVSAQGGQGVFGGGRRGLQETDQGGAGDGGVKRGAHKAGCDVDGCQAGFLADDVTNDRKRHAGYESTHDGAGDHAETGRGHPPEGPKHLPPQDQPLKRSEQDSDSERGQKKRGYEYSVDPKCRIDGGIHVGAGKRTENSADTAGHDPPAGLGEAPTQHECLQYRHKDPDPRVAP